MDQEAKLYRGRKVYPKPQVHTTFRNFKYVPDTGAVSAGLERIDFEYDVKLDVLNVVLSDGSVELWTHSVELDAIINGEGGKKPVKATVLPAKVKQVQQRVTVKRPAPVEADQSHIFFEDYHNRGVAWKGTADHMRAYARIVGDEGKLGHLQRVHGIYAPTPDQVVKMAPDSWLKSLVN